MSVKHFLFTCYKNIISKNNDQLSDHPLCDGQTSLFGCRNVQHAHIAATENLEGHPLGPRHQRVRVPGVPGVRVARQCQAATEGTTPGVQPGETGMESL